MADGAVLIDVGMNVSKAEKELEKLKQKIVKTEQELGKNTERRSGIQQEIADVSAQLDEATEKVRTLKEEYGKSKGDTKAGIKVQLAEALEDQKALTSEANRLNREYDSVSKSIGKGTEQLAAMKDQAGGIERALDANRAGGLSQVSTAVKAVSASMRAGVKSILKWGVGIRSAFILVRRLRSAIVDGVKAFAEQDEETKNNINGLKSALSTLKISWGAAFAPILNAVAPILQKLIAWLTQAANAVQMFFAALGGKSTYKKAIANNDALAKSYGAAGGAAKEAQKNILGFDEINKLNDNSGGGGGGGSAPATNLVDEQIPNKFAKFIDLLKGNIYELETIVGDALLAIGAIFLFTWTNPVLGLGMIAAGLAMKYNVAINWGALPDAMRQEITLLDSILGTSLLAIGAILAFSNPASMALGIGLMAAGAVMLGSAVALNWDALKNYIKNNVADVLGILGTALLVVGAIIAFACPHLLPLGIGLMAAGGLSLLTGGVMGIDWNYIKDRVRDVIDKINGYLDRLKNKWEEIKKSASDLKDRVVTKFNEIKDKISETVGKIKDFFSFEWKLPEIQLPHLTVSWEPLDGSNPIARLFGIGSIPHLGISWYAKGGIVDGATLIGAGEAGKEAIVPLERNTEWINLVADRLIDRITQSNRLADYISGIPLPAMATGQIVPPRALSGGGSIFTDGDIERLVSGISAAFMGSESGGEQSIKLFLDGRQIAETVTKHQRRMERGR